jgi:dihydrolipoamide dehydrogenase
MPSKALLRPVELFAAGQALPGVAGALSGPLDVGAVLERRNRFTHERDDSSQVSWAEGAGIDVVRGHGRLAGERTVAVSDADAAARTLHARHAVVIATGSSAAIPPVDGLREARPWTSRDVTNLEEVPRRVVVIGGGVVACESATWLRGLGAEEVTVVEVVETLLAQHEPMVGQLIAEEFSTRGIAVLTGAEVTSVQRPDVEDTGIGRIHGGPARISVAHDSFEVDEVVVAAGRTPDTADLGLERIGIDLGMSGGYLATDEHMGVIGAGEWLYAVGDVCGRALLTHMGKYQARVAGDVIAARAERRPLHGMRYRDLADDGVVPAVAFTDPQVAAVGLTEAAARERGIDVQAVDYDLGSVAGAKLLRDGYAGCAKLVVDRRTGTLVGATFVGADVAELLHSATIAIVGKVDLETLWHAVPSYPTVSEVWLRLLESRRREEGSTGSRSETASSAR